MVPVGHAGREAWWGVALAVAAMGSILPGSAEGKELLVQEPRDVEVLHIPAGPDSSQVSPQDCKDCKYCQVGFAMAGYGDVILYYDFGYENLKVISLAEETPRPVEVIPGPGERPFAGVRDQAGHIYLLIDRHDNSWSNEYDRFVIYARAPDGTAWESILSLEHGAFGFGTREDSDVVISMALSLGVDSSGTVYMFDKSKSIPVARDGARLAQLPTSSSGPPIQVVGVGARPVAETTGEPVLLIDGKHAHALRGANLGVIGTADDGSWYSKSLFPDWRASLEKWNARGELVASVELRPKEPTPCQLRRGSLLFTESGRIYRLRVDPDGLTIKEVRFPSVQP